MLILCGKNKLNEKTERATTLSAGLLFRALDNAFFLIFILYCCCWCAHVIFFSCLYMLGVLRLALRVFPDLSKNVFAKQLKKRAGKRVLR